MSWRPKNWETPGCEESEKWLKEAEDRLRQDRKFWGGKEAGDNGEVQSAERAVSKDKNFAKGFEAGADAMLEALEASGVRPVFIEEGRRQKPNSRNGGYDRSEEII